MGPYILRRLLLMIPVLLAISIVVFIIIQLPPGDFLTIYVNELEALGENIDQALVDSLKARYGIDQPLFVKYAKWLWGVLRGDFGRSLRWNRPVSDIILERLPWSMVVTLMSFLFVNLVGIPIGVLSSTQQYSIKDYFFTFIGFIGLATPNFLFALVLLYFWFEYTGEVRVGLFSYEYVMAPWSFGKLIDLFKHLWIPAIVIGTAGTAGTIRTMRANLLDELQKQYVMVARSKGISEAKLLYKYPFRVAINPWVSTIGWLLPSLVSGELLVSLVIGLPTLGPILYSALLNQDMFLAGSIIMILSTLTVIGTLISDIILAWVDPRIRESI